MQLGNEDYKGTTSNNSALILLDLEEEDEDTGYRVLDRSCKGVLQHRQFQLPHGYNCGTKYVPSGTFEKNGKSFTVIFPFLQ